MEKRWMVSHVNPDSIIYLRAALLSGLFNLGFSWVEIGSVTPKPQVSQFSTRVLSFKSEFGNNGRLVISQTFPVTLVSSGPAAIIYHILLEEILLQCLQRIDVSERTAKKHGSLLVLLFLNYHARL